MLTYKKHMMVVIVETEEPITAAAARAAVSDLLAENENKKLTIEILNNEQPAEKKPEPQSKPRPENVVDAPARKTKTSRAKSRTKRKA